MQSVGVRVHTPPRLHYLRLRLGFGRFSLHFVTSDCGRLQKAPSNLRPHLHYISPTPYNRRLQSLSTTFLKSGASRVMSCRAYCWKYSKRTPTCRKAFVSEPHLLTTYVHRSSPIIVTRSSPSVLPGGGTAFNAIVTGILPAPVAATRTGSVISQYGSS